MSLESAVWVSLFSRCIEVTRYAIKVVRKRWDSLQICLLKYRDNRTGIPFQRHGIFGLGEEVTVTRRHILSNSDEDSPRLDTLKSQYHFKDEADAPIQRRAIKFNRKPNQFPFMNLQIGARAVRRHDARPNVCVPNKFILLAVRPLLSDWQLGQVF